MSGYGGRVILARTPEFTPLPCIGTLPLVEGDVTRVGVVAREYVTRARAGVR